MKRSKPLTRRVGLSQGKGLKPGPWRRKHKQPESAPVVVYDRGRLLRMVLRRDHGVDFLAETTGLEPIGMTDPCHVIPKSFLRVHFKWGAIKRNGVWRPLKQGELVRPTDETRSVEAILMDPDNVVPGARNLHTAWDAAALAIAREQLPAHVERFAAGHGLMWWLDRNYRRRAA